MNKKFLRAGMIFASLLAVLSFGACSDDEGTDEPVPAPVPELTSLTPDALTWDAKAVDAKTITIKGKNLKDATITLSALTHYTAKLEGTTVTVTPKAANADNKDVVEKLTISVKDGNSLEATLTQKAAEAEPEPEPEIPALKSLTPNALTWEAAAVDAKTITIAGDYLDGATITLSTLTAFTATLEGKVVTVTPKAANADNKDVVEKLTVSLKDGNSLEATLTQKAKPAPELTSLTPDALTWDAEAVDAKTITINGKNLEGVEFTLSALTHYTATVAGTTITVTPAAANELAEPVVEKLTVTLGEKTLEATLTHSAKGAEPTPEPTTKTWKMVTETPTNGDWSGEYLFVFDQIIPDKIPVPRAWNLTLTGDNRVAVILSDDGKEIVSARTHDNEANEANQSIALEDLVNYIVKIEKVEGGYTLQCSPANTTTMVTVDGVQVPVGGKYIYNAVEDLSTNGIFYSENPVIGASSIDWDSSDGGLEIWNGAKTHRFALNPNQQRKFNFFPVNETKNEWVNANSGAVQRYNVKFFKYE